MKTKELRELSVEELNRKLIELKEELFNLRCQAKMGQIEKISNIRNLKKTIARTKTLINEKKKN